MLNFELHEKENQGIFLNIVYIHVSLIYNTNCIYFTYFAIRDRCANDL